jgi:uncharacterized protein YdeI (YjbR/CyaY-like superfamily)
MYKTHPEIDKFIDSLSGWQHEICVELRKAIHKSLTNGYEDWKWGCNFKNSKGTMIAGLWAFKKHVALIFFEGVQIEDKYKIFTDGLDNKRSRVIKFFSLDDFNKEKLKQIEEYLEASKDLNPTPRPIKKVPVQKIPKEIEKILKDNNVLKNFKSMSNSHQKEYLEYIKEAKKEETRQRRILHTIERLKEDLTVY